MNTISKYIKEIRQSLNLTQKIFAEKIGKTRGDIAKYETEKAIPPGDILLKIQALKKTIQHRRSSER